MPVCPPLLCFHFTLRHVGLEFRDIFGQLSSPALSMWSLIFSYTSLNRMKGRGFSRISIIIISEVACFEIGSKQVGNFMTNSATMSFSVLILVLSVRYFTIEHSAFIFGVQFNKYFVKEKKRFQLYFTYFLFHGATARAHVFM
jgi:hypothetical protein